MKDETGLWVSYADENLAMCRLALEHRHLNACLQNAQQGVEKYLKAVMVERELEFRRTHSVRELVAILAAHRISADISEEEMDLMDTIYVPSKYPDYSALPATEPNEGICDEALRIARKVGERVRSILGGGGSRA
ncbi:MAG: HEPN domain-containing protein [Planctomycetota bacterium]